MHEVGRDWLSASSHFVDGCILGTLDTEMDISTGFRVCFRPLLLAPPLFPGVDHIEVSDKNTAFEPLHEGTRHSLEQSNHLIGRANHDVRY